MALIVQKFGGSSLAEPALIRRCAQRVAETRRAGHDVVVVVSAMGDTTDDLLALASRISDKPASRELDVLLATGEQASSSLMAMALHAEGVDAVSLCGSALGILTDPGHRRARIRSIDVDRIRTQLGRGRVVVAAGFQGVSIDDGDITTLGRGGSDTTAVALAAALDASSTGGLCEIYTDVDGVYTADPRRVPGARRMNRIGCEEMLELASVGAGVLHPRAVQFGHTYGVPIRVLHSQKDPAELNRGTMIVKETPDMESTIVAGCALTTDLGRITIRDLDNAPGTVATLFQWIAERDLLVDDIMQIASGNRVDLSFTVESQELAEVRVAVQNALDGLGLGSTELAVEVGLAKVSAVGAGMRTHTGVAARMFGALADAGISIANVTTSEIKISCIVTSDQGDHALQVVHDAFNLGGAVTAGRSSGDDAEPATV